VGNAPAECPSLCVQRCRWSGWCARSVERTAAVRNAGQMPRPREGKREIPSSSSATATARNVTSCYYCACNNCICVCEREERPNKVTRSPVPLYHRATTTTITTTDTTAADGSCYGRTPYHYTLSLIPDVHRPSSYLHERSTATYPLTTTPDDDPLACRCTSVCLSTCLMLLRPVINKSPTRLRHPRLCRSTWRLYLSRSYSSLVRQSFKH
jgi:hypothetical protein